MQSKPFFTRFLKSQSSQVRTGVQAGRTLKYPSDKDEIVPDN